MAAALGGIKYGVFMRSQDVIFFAGIAVILLVPTALIAFVVMNGKADRQRQMNAWQTFAARLGGHFVPGSGAFSGHRMTIPRPHALVVIETVMVSVMDAVRSPYFPDGGTFTVVKAMHPTGRGRIFRAMGAQVLSYLSPSGGAGGRHLPAGAMVHSSPGEVVCVMRGAVNQEADLYTALMVVSDLSTPI